MIDLLALAADLEAAGARAELRDVLDPCLWVYAGELTMFVPADGTAVIATDKGGASIALPGIETDALAIVARHAERMRPARAA